jgi:hypothetical protein
VGRREMLHRSRRRCPYRVSRNFAGASTGLVSGSRLRPNFSANGELDPAVPVPARAIAGL